MLGQSGTAITSMHQLYTYKWWVLVRNNSWTASSWRLGSRNSSMIRATTENNLILLNRRRCALRSLCNDLRSFRFSPLTISFLYISVFINSTRGLFCSRLRELHTLKGHVESLVKLKGLDIETVQQHFEWETVSF